MNPPVADLLGISGQRLRLGEPTWGITSLFPLQGDWTEAEYLALKTNRLLELRDGFLEVLPMPTILHQLLVMFLRDQLQAFVSAHATGLVLVAPLPVRLWSKTFREPDVLYARPERVSNVKGYPAGADLVMEVVSDDAESRKRDYDDKRQDYAQAGIAEYWIVDPAEERLTVLTLDGSMYRQHGEFHRGQQATSRLLPGFALDVNAVFAQGRLASL